VEFVKFVGDQRNAVGVGGDFHRGISES
jgi:hypothetical protein